MMSNKEYSKRTKDFFLSCLSDICQGAGTEKPDEMLDLEELFLLANEHCLDSLIYSQCRKWMGIGKASQKFRGIFNWHVFYAVNRADFVREITERFRKENIDLLFFKGSVFRDYYPEPALRTMGDIDFLIHTEDRKAADRILREDMGMERLIDNHSVWTYWKGDFQFEVHDHIFYENLASRVDYISYFDSIWEHCHNGPVFGIWSDNLYVPDEEYHFLYLMTHMAKHIINSGSGFRAYMDIVFFCKACRDINWDFISEQLDKLLLTTFTGISMGLCERWFNVKLPFSAEMKDTIFIEQIEEKTFRDGVFGLHNSDNKNAGAAKEIKRNESGYIIGALKRIIRILFPPYRDMQLVPWYSFVDGRPWLLPFAWIYRWFYCLFMKGRHGRKLITEPFLQAGEVKKRQEYLSRWGL